MYFLKSFREGKLGPWTLDDLDGAEEAYVEAHREARAPEAHMRYTDLGAVGVLPSSGVSGVASAAEPDAGAALGGDAGVSLGESAGREEVAPVPLSLDQRVMLTVGRFLDQAAEEKADAEAGRNMSPTQIKKQERKAKMDERIAKSEARRARAAKAAGGRR